MLLTSGLLFGLVFIYERRARATRAVHWGLLAALFTLLSLEETIGLHELTSEFMQARFVFTGPLHFAWVIPGIAAVLVFACTFARFVLALPAKTRTLFCLAFSIYVCGAVGMEMVGGSSISESDGDLYPLWVHIEEFLEMMGVITFIYALLDYLERFHSGAPIRVGEESGAA